jgi:hypothetical protein
MLLFIAIRLGDRAGDNPGPQIRALLTEWFDTRVRHPLREHPATEGLFDRLDVEHAGR